MQAVVQAIVFAIYGCRNRRCHHRVGFSTKMKRPLQQEEQDFSSIGHIMVETENARSLGMFNVHVWLYIFSIFQ